jgi:outer membrane protein assembly factor BamB
MERHDPQHTNCTPFLGPERPTRWIKISEEGWQAWGAALASDGTLYVHERRPDQHDRLVAYDKEGRIKWSYSGRFEIFLHSPAIGPDGTIYITGMRTSEPPATLCALDPNGQLKWSYEIHGLAISSPMVSGNEICVVGAEPTGEENLYLFNSKGELRSNRQIPSIPAIGQDSTIYTGTGSTCIAIRPDGKIKWKCDLGNRIMTAPVVAPDGSVYLGTRKTLEAINPDGTHRWSFPLDYPLNFSVSQDGTIYTVSALSGDNKLYALNPDGSIKWFYELPAHAHDISPVIDGRGIVYVIAGDTLLAVNPNGELKWQVKTRTKRRPTAVIIGENTIYLCALDGVYVMGRVGNLIPFRLITAILVMLILVATGYAGWRRFR